MVRRLAPLLTLALVTACSGSGESAVPVDGGSAVSTTSTPSTTATTPTTTTTTTTTTPASTSTSVPVFSLDDHVEWLLAGLRGAEVTEEDYERRFDEGFRAEVPAQAVSAGLAQLAGDWRIVTESRSGSEAELLVESSDGPSLAAYLSMEPQPPHRLRGLLLQPAELTDPPSDLDELALRWAELAAASQLLIADVTDGDCAPVVGDLGQRRLAVGSVFKLWVLGTVAGEIAAGRLAWDDPVVIRDRLDSLPSGTTQDEPAGSELTVEELARRMISVSDNTATDHLIDLVGRERVEEAQAHLGHLDPGANRPFLLTREAFELKLGPDPAILQRYAEAGEDERRRLLAELEVELPPLDEIRFDTPVAIDTIEWFASVGDLCRTLVTLDRLRASPGLEPVGSILTLNPGVRADPVVWPEVAFKGGSEPGVLAFAWLARRADGRSFVIAAAANDDATAVDQITGALLMEAGFGLLGDHQAP